MKYRHIHLAFTGSTLLALFLLGTSSLAQEISRADLGKIIDYAQLSEAVYADRRMPELPDGWKLLERDATLSGLQWGLYERQGPNGTRERVLAFAGTQDLKDWLTNAAQALRNGIRGTGITIPGVTIPADQYQAALQVAMRFIEAKDKDGKMSLVITGHSLGGGLGQYVSLKTGVTAVLFNAAALGPETVRDIAPQLREGASRQITHISLHGDLVHNQTRSALEGQHFGVEYVVDPAPGAPDIFPLDAPLLPALYLKEWKNDKLARHAMTTIISSLRYTQAYGDIQQKMSARAADTGVVASVANWWTVATPKKPAGQLLAEARSMTEMARNAKRVVIVGEGPAAELMAQHMTEQLGAGNVVRLAGAGDAESAQRRAHQVNADLILGVRPSPGRVPVNPNTEERIAELREPLENVVATVKTTIEALQKLGRPVKAENKLARWMTSPGNERLNKGFEHADTLYGLMTALEQDLAMASRGEFALVRSHVLEETARIGVEHLLPQLQETLLKNGKARVLPATFGAVDGVTAVARALGAGSVDVETWALGLDAVNSAAWGALALAISGGNLEVASLTESIVSTFAKVTRDSSKAWFTRTWAWFHYQPLTVEAMWRTLQESNAHRNLKVQTIEQVFGKEVLDQSGFSRADLARLNADAAHYERLRLALSRSGSSPAPRTTPSEAKLPMSSPSPDVGGIWGQVTVDHNAFGRLEGEKK